MSGVRAPAVAGLFYPADPTELREQIDTLMRRSATSQVAERRPKAVVAPHAGYIYSGPIAASAYARVAELRGTVTRVVLLGPAHRVPVRGLAVPTVDALRTPLGDVSVDDELRTAVSAHPAVVLDDLPHAEEHSIEVQLPFLQRALGDFTLLPLVVGNVEAEVVADVLDAVWGGPETLIVVSTDLSHYESHDAAVIHDEHTVAAIVAGNGAEIGPYDACGATPLRGLMTAASRHGIEPHLLDRRTSGETAGQPNRVVGYASLVYS